MGFLPQLFLLFQLSHSTTKEQDAAFAIGCFPLHLEIQYILYQSLPVGQLFLVSPVLLSDPFLQVLLLQKTK